MFRSCSGLEFIASFDPVKPAETALQMKKAAAEGRQIKH
jgi:hypothetical protein